MDKPVVITGIGLRSALGTLSETWQAILLGMSGLVMHQPFPELPARPMGLIDHSPLQNLSPLALAIITEALNDAHLSHPLPDCGVVVGSSRHHQGVLEALTQTKLSSGSSLDNLYPWVELDSSTSCLESWMQRLPGGTAIAVARFLQSTGPVLSPMNACATGLWAIAQGYELIQMGQCEQAIVATVEAPITPLTLAGFEQAGVLARTGVYPFDINREGLAIAEGGAAFVLETLASAQRRHISPYGAILGFGLAADAYHMSTPDPQGKGARGALRACFQHSGLRPDDIGYIHTHGTGTYWNDQSEAQLISQEFPRPPACSSTKGSTGHTLGASGALGTALTLMALKTQTLPPNVGLRSPAVQLPLVTQSRSTNLQTALCLSFGFGGQSAVVALAQPT